MRTSLAGAALLAGAVSTADAARLCLDPIGLPFPPDERSEVLERRIAQVFEAGGFDVVESSEVRAAIERVDEEWGAIFDSYTGRRDPERTERFLAELARALGEDGLGCDHRLMVSVVVLRARFVGGNARWDGRTVSITSGGRKVLNALAGVVEHGWVAALSLWVAIADLDGEPVGFRSAGIEPLVRLSLTHDMDRLPEDSWLTDDTALDEAIRVALGTGASELRDRGTPLGALPAGQVAWPSR